MFEKGIFNRGSVEIDNLLGSPVKYTALYVWGGIRVTEAADEAYKFVPLMSDLSHEEVLPSPISENLPFCGDIVLLSTEEYYEETNTKSRKKEDIFSQFANPEDYATMQILVKSEANDQGVRVRAALEGSIDDLVETQQENLSQIPELMPELAEELEARLEDLTPDSLYQNTKQTMVHFIG